MKVKVATLLLGLSVAFGAHAGSSLTLEQRVAQLESQSKATEQRAIAAETELAKLKQQPSTPGKKSVISTFEDVDVKLSGDVEFNVDGVSRTGGIVTNDQTSNYFAGGKGENWGLNGRILLGFDAIQNTSSGHYAGVTVQPLADMSGKMNLDDAAFFFGAKEDWQFKIGRYEAYDMFPLNQDTFVQYSGNTANDIYDDGYGYTYQMKEGRGRSSSGGGILLSKQIGGLYFETNALIEDGSQLFVDGKYHGNNLENRKNVVYLRPVLAYTTGPWTAAVAAETNVIRNAYGYEDGKGTFVSQSKRNGYGATFKYDTLKNDPTDGITVNLSTAYLDASNERDFSVGTNALWKRFELGYIYGRNSITKFNTSEISQTCSENCDILKPGNYEIHTVHASYHLPDILDMPNFNIYVGGYSSFVKSAALQGDSNDRYGARVRFKYFF